MEDDRLCPDGGTCHHDCVVDACYRVGSCGPLSGVYPGDVWPQRVTRALGGRMAVARTLVERARAARLHESAIDVLVCVALADGSPTVRELCAGAGLASPSTVQMHLGTLRRHGLVTWEQGRARTLRVVLPD